VDRRREEKRREERREELFKLNLKNFPLFM